MTLTAGRFLTRQNAVRDLAKIYLSHYKELKASEKSKIVSNIMNKLDKKENSLEVKTFTVRELSKMSRNMSDTEIIEIFKKTVEELVKPDEDNSNDIYSTCIKTVLKNLSHNSAEAVANIIIPKLVTGIFSNEEAIAEIALDTMDDFLRSFAYKLRNVEIQGLEDKLTICNRAILNLNKSNETLKINSVNFMGSFSGVLSKEELQKLSSILIEKFNSETELQAKLPFFSVLNEIIRRNADKMVDYSEDIYKLVKSIILPSFLEDNEAEYEACNDLAEEALNILEAFILKYGNRFSSKFSEVISISLELSKYDPNYNYENQEVDAEYDDYYDDMIDDYDVGVDDSSWKVRRGAIKVLFALLKSRSHLQKSVYGQIIEELVSCMREHDENVKLEIIECLTSFLKSMVVEEQALLSKASSQGLTRQSSMVDEIVPVVAGSIIQNCKKELEKFEMKKTEVCLELLRAVAVAAPSCLLENIQVFFDNINDTFEAHPVFTIPWLIVLRKIVSGLEVMLEGFDDVFEALTSFSEKAVKDNSVKTNIEGFNLAYAILRLYCTVDSFNTKGNADKFYNLLIIKYKENDIDQELKSISISCMLRLVNKMGHHFDDEKIKSVFEMLVEKVSNKTLLSVAYQHINKLLKDESKVNLKAALPVLTKIVGDNLISNMTLIQSQSIETLINLLAVYPDCLADANRMFKDTLSLIEDSHSSILESAYILLNSLAEHYNIDAKLIEDALLKAQEVFKRLSKYNPDHHSLLTFIKTHCGKVKKSALEQIYTSLYSASTINENQSKLLSVLSIANGNAADLKKNVVQEASKKSEKRKFSVQVMGDLCLAMEKAEEADFQLLGKIAATASEDVAVTASLSLGKLGRLDFSGFNKALDMVISKEKNYFAVLAIRQLLEILHESKFTGVDKKALAFLFDFIVGQADHTKTTIESAVGDALGIISQDQAYLDKLFEMPQSDNQETRATGMLGLKQHLKYKKERLDDSQVTLLFMTVIKACEDSFLRVRVHAFESLMLISNDYSNYIKDSFNSVLDLLLKYCVVDDSLVSMIDIGGQLKIKTDLGEPIRKSIITTIKNLFDKMPLKFTDLSSLVDVHLNGLSDTASVNMLCQPTLLKVASMAPETFTSKLEKIYSIFTTLCNEVKDLKKDKSKVKDIKKVTDAVSFFSKLIPYLEGVVEIAEHSAFRELNFLKEIIQERYCSE